MKALLFRLVKKFSGLAICLLLCSGGQAAAQEQWRALMDQALDLYNKGETEQAYRTAISSLEQYRASGAAANEAYANLLYLSSLACHGTDRFEEGIELISKAIQIQQKTPGSSLVLSRILLAQLYSSLGKYGEAAAAFEEVVRLLEAQTPADEQSLLETRFQWATVLFLAGQREKSLSVFSPISESKVQDEEILIGFFNYGQLLLELGRAAEALAVLQRIKIETSNSDLSESRAYPLLVRALGDARLATGDWAGAALEFSEALPRAVSSEQENMLASLAVASIRQRNTSKALRYIRQRVVTDESKVRVAALYTQIAGVMMEDSRSDSARYYLRYAFQMLDPGKREHLPTLSDISRALGQFEEEHGQLGEAKNMYARALESARASGNNAKLASALNRLAALFLRMNDDKSASPLIVETMQMLKTGQLSDLESIQTLRNLGTISHNRSNYARSDSAFRAALTMTSKTTGISPLTVVAVRSQYGKCLQMRGDLSAAAGQMITARNGLGVGGSVVQYCRLTGNIAGLNLLMGKAQMAQAQIDSAINLILPQANRYPVDYASLLLVQARGLLASGAYTKSEQAGARVVSVLKQNNSPDPELMVLALDHQANVYKTLGNYPAAEPLIQQALKELEASGRKESATHASLLQNLATLYQLQDKFDQAEKILQQALDLDLKTLGKNHPAYAVSLQNMAALKLKRGKQAEALQFLESARDIVTATAGRESRTYGTLSANLASLYQDLGRYEEAEKEWLACLALRTKILGKEHPDYLRAVYGVAGLYFATGKLDKASPYFEEAVSRNRAQVQEFFSAMSDRERTAFYMRVKPVFEAYMDFAFQAWHKTKDPSMLDRLYDLQLATKSILLSSSNRVRENILGGQNEELKGVFREWIRKKEELVHLYSAGKDGQAQSAVNIAALQEQANSLEKKLAMESALFSNELSKKAPDWRMVRDALHPEECAVEFIRVRRKYVKDSVYYVALVVRKGMEHPEATVLSAGMLLENRWYPFYRNTTVHLLEDSLSFDRFWKPVVPLLRDAKRVYVSSDGILNKVSINGLYDGVSRSYVLDRYDLQMVGNTAELVRPPVATAAVREAAIFGYPDFNLNGHKGSDPSATRKGALLDGMPIPDLPATQSEVQLVGRLLAGSKWKVLSFADKEASEENIKKVSSPGLLHIATHGFFQPDPPKADELESVGQEEVLSNPLFRSGLLLTGAGVSPEGRPEDGLLTAYEAMNLDLSRTEMVCLSACETGLGDVMNGEGVYGLQRAFQVAGAKSLMMSLWQVDDAATQELMTAYYQKWISGLPKNEAFRKAQIQIREKYDSPYFWAAFVLLGK